MVREAARRVPVRLAPDPLGQVLLDRPARRHVQHLHAAADAEQRQVALERPVPERELEAVPLRTRSAGLRVRPRAVRAGIDVGAAGEDEAVEEVEQLVGRLGRGVVGREQQRDPAGALHGQRVGARHEIA